MTRFMIFPTVVPLPRAGPYTSSFWCSKAGTNFPWCYWSRFVWSIFILFYHNKINVFGLFASLWSLCMMNNPRIAKKFITSVNNLPRGELQVLEPWTVTLPLNCGKSYGIFCDSSIFHIWFTTGIRIQIL